MTTPNFVVVGAGRSGTTSLHRFLGQHPDVFMCPSKSPNFFASSFAQPAWETPVARAMAAQWVSDPADYAALFDDAGPQRAVGEVSPVYLQATGVADLIADTCGPVRIIAVLRNPVDRACAHFLGRQRDGIEPPGVAMGQRMDELLALGMPDDVAFGHYPGCGRYHHFLAPYQRRFGRDAVHVAVYDDLVANPHGVLGAMFDFLGIDGAFRCDVSARLNATGHIRSPLRRAVWTRTATVRTALRPHLPARLRTTVGGAFLGDLDRPVVDPALRQRLRDALADDISELADTWDLDVGHWLTE